MLTQLYSPLIHCPGRTQPLPAIPAHSVSVNHLTPVGKVPVHSWEYKGKSYLTLFDWDRPQCDHELSLSDGTTQQRVTQIYVGKNVDVLRTPKQRVTQIYVGKNLDVLRPS